jgi:hypothetical protein
MKIKQLQQLAADRHLGFCHLPAYKARASGYFRIKLADLLKFTFSLLASDGKPSALAIVAFGSAVAMPREVPVTRCKYWLFGRKYTTMKTVLPEANDADFAVICRENQFDQRNLRGEIINYYDGSERVSQDIHLVFIGLEELRKSAHDTSLSNHILTSGFVLAGEENVSLEYMCQSMGLRRVDGHIRPDWLDDGDSLNVHLRYTDTQQEAEHQPEEEETIDSLLDGILTR